MGVKKEKALSAEQLAKKEAKRLKQIAKLEKEKNKSRWIGYFACFLFIITVVYMVDELTSQIGSQMQTIIATEIFAPIVGEEFAVARMSAFGITGTIASALSFLYKPLSDKYGRKIFLIINTLGMGIGMLLVGISTNIPVYVIGATIMAFFVPHDMQATYIYESTPPKHRGKIYSIIKAIATVCVLLIPVLRNVFISASDSSKWVYVYIIPGIIAFVTAVLAIFLMRESDAYIDSKLRILKMSDEEKEQAKNKKEEVESNGGLIVGIKCIVKNKQLLWLIAVYALQMIAMLMTGYYETIINSGYAKQFLDQGMSLSEANNLAKNIVSQALLLFPIGCALATFVQGFLADKFGRRKAFIIMSVSIVLAFLGFYFGSKFTWNQYLVGLLTGIAVGSVWSAGDIVILMIAESSPTKFRASIQSVAPLMAGAPYGLVMGLAILFMNIFGDAIIPVIILATAVPTLLGAIFILFTKVKETNATKLDDIGEI